MESDDIGFNPSTRSSEGSPVGTSGRNDDFQDAVSEASWNEFGLQQPAESEDDVYSVDSLEWHIDGCGLHAHRMAFEGDIPALERWLKDNPGDISVGDTHGNTVLHIAVIRCHHEMVEMLLRLGARAEKVNARGWTALEHALSLSDRRMAKALYMHRIGELKTAYKAKKKGVVQHFARMPNYRMQMSWELSSHIFGPFIRHYAPHDTYDIWKLGDRLRVDGTLMGIDGESKGIIPEWKRGRFSLLFHPLATEDGKSRVVALNRETRKWADLTAQRRAAGGASYDSEVSLLLQDGAGRTKMKTLEKRFKPAKNWLGGAVHERVDGWKTTVFEAQARLLAVTTYKTPIRLDGSCSFDDYLQMEFAPDKTRERPLDPLSMDALFKPRGAGGPSQRSQRAADKKAPRKVTSRLWMAENFPISLSDFLPIMDIIGHANKHMKRVSEFMRKYGERSLFPVKIHVPLIMTVFAMVCFRKFEFLQAGDEGLEPGFYEIPPDFEETTVEEMFGVRSAVKPKQRRAKTSPELDEWEEGKHGTIQPAK